MKQFILAPDQTPVSFEELPTIDTSRSVTILEFSALTILVHANGRQHLLPQTIELGLRTQFFPDTLELYSLTGECLLLLSEEEFGVIADRTRQHLKLVNVPFAIDKVHTEIDDEWSMAVFHLKGRTLRVSQALHEKVSAEELGVDLFVEL